MRKRRSPIGIIVLLLIAVGVVGAVFYLTSQANTASTNTVQVAPQVTVYQPVDTIPSFTILTPDLFAKIQVDSDQIKNKGFINTAAGTGSTTIFGKMSRVPLYKGSTVREDQVTDPGMSSFIPTVEPNSTPTISNTHRLIALPVGDETGVGGLVTDGDLVDILFSVYFDLKETTPTSVPGQTTAQQPSLIKPQLGTKTILQAIRVVRVIQLPVPPDPKASPRHATDAAQTILLLLDVNPEQAEIIKYMRDLFACQPSGQCNYQNGPGGMSLTLRNSKDTATFPVLSGTPGALSGVDAPTLVEKYGMKAPNLLLIQQPTPTP